MALKIPNGGEVRILQQLKTYFNSLRLHLFVNDVTITDVRVVGDLVETTITGFESVIPASFGDAFLNPSSVAEIDAALQTFTSTGSFTPETVFGYFFTDSTGVLIWAERNPLGGQLVDAAGQQYPVLPKFTFETKF